MNMQVSPENLFLTVEQVAARYGVSKDSIWRWKRNGRFPAVARHEVLQGVTTRFAANDFRSGAGETHLKSPLQAS